MAHGLPQRYGDDFFCTGMDPTVDARLKDGVDEWGARWENMGTTNLGEVKEFPLTDWAGLDALAIPDIRDPKRWEGVLRARELAGDKYVLGNGVSIYERVHFLRGFQNTWIDVYEAQPELNRMIGILVDMNLYAIEQFAKADADGIIIFDDWGLQQNLMIDPAMWRSIWKPHYARIFRAAHDAGLHTFMHSCGYIVDILDDLIDAGLDVIQMDQQQNMGLTLLGERFGGRITFWSPVDIQNMMVNGSLDDIRAYCREMVLTLGRPNGGFIAMWYGDPQGAGHRPEAIDAMCQEFIRLSQDYPNLWKQTAVGR